MMIKRQIGVLAGAVVAASSANAAITLGADALAVFNKVGGGSYYQLVGAPGNVTGDTLSAGVGFSIDISGALAALGGTIDSFALLAIKSGGGDIYNYTEFVYVDAGGGLVYAGSSATSSTNIALQDEIGLTIQGFLNNANIGLNGEGSLGDFDSLASMAAYLNTGTVSLVQNLWNGDGGSTSASLISLTAPGGSAEGVYIDGTSFNATAQVSAVPVPAAAWLFGSALVGLGVVRRKK